MAESETNRFFRKLFGFSLGPIINAGLGFISVPITTWFIVPEELGRASMFTTAHSLIGMFVYLGLDSAYQRHYHEVDDHGQLLFQALWPPTVLVAAISTVLLAFYPFVSHALYGITDFLPVLLLVAYLVVHIGMHYSQYILLMRQKSKAYSAGQVLEKVSRVTMLVAFMLLFERTFRSVILASITAQIITSTYFFLVSRSHWRLQFRFDWHLQRDMFRFGLPFVPAAALSWIFNSIDKIAIRTWSDFDQIGIYAGAFKLVAALAVVRKSFGSFWPPLALRWHSNEAPNHHYQRVTDTLISVMAPMYVFIVLMRNVVYVILSPAYASSAGIVPFLLFIPLMATVSETTVLGITFSKKTHLHVVVTAVAAVINVVGNALLVPTYGAIGAAISTGISFNVFFWMRTWLSARQWPVLSFQLHILNSVLMAAMASATLIPHPSGRVIEAVLAILTLGLNAPNLWRLSQRLYRTIWKRGA